MLFHLADKLQAFWGPFRLFGSVLVLMGLGSTVALFSVLCGLPRWWRVLPCDKGKVHVGGKEGSASIGKPTGAGFLLVLLLLPVILLVVPFSVRLLGILGCLLLAMLTGYLDDRAATPWGDYFKGALDLLVTSATSVFFCLDRARLDQLAATPWSGKVQQFFTGSVELWLPLVKGNFALPVWLFLIFATVLLWWTINATNCSDGVDGLAGTLSLLSIFFLAMFLYIVVGHTEAARYLLVPHVPDGSHWAVLLTTIAGGLAGYLWYNAEPSRVLMGDAGSRFLGLLVGVAVLASGNPFLALVVAPVVLVNGGTGIVKILTLRLFKRLGFETRTPLQLKQAAATAAPGTVVPGHHPVVAMLHSVRFPLHDHCRKNLGWSNAQVLLRFLIIQAFLTPVLFGLLVKIR